MQKADGARGSARLRAPGRPQRLPNDPTPFEARSFGVLPRMAWLLLTTRLDPHGLGITRDELVRRFRAIGISADPTRVSRWESGQLQPPEGVLKAYEAALGFADGHLRAIQQLMRRASHDDVSDAGVAVMKPAGREQVAQTLLTRLTDASAGATLSGADWVCLATALSGFEHIFLEDRTWQRVCSRLLNELVRTEGAGRLLRYQACVALVTHPASQHQMVRTIGEWLTDGDAQYVELPMQLLQELAAPQSSEIVLRLMLSDRTQQSAGAVGVAAVKVSRGHFSEAGLATLGEFVRDRIRAAGNRTISAGLLDLLVHLPEPHITHAIAAVTDPALRRQVEVARQHASLNKVGTALAIGRKVAAQAQASDPSETRNEPDQMLQRLIRESLFHVHALRRDAAAQVLAASPYALRLAEIGAGLVTGPDQFIAERMWSLLRHLPHGSRHEQFVTAAISADRPALQIAGLRSIGVGPTRLDESDLDRIVELAPTLSGGERAAALFSIGRQSPSRLRDIRHLAPDVEQAASWWERVGAVIATNKSTASTRSGGPVEESCTRP